MRDIKAGIVPPNFLSLCLVLLLVICYFSTFPDLDYTWQIRLGEHIVHSGQLQTPEPFSYTIPGKILPDFEWLYEVVLYLVWSALGFGGLRLLKTLLIATPLLLVVWRLRSEAVSWPGILLACFLAVLVLVPGWNLRALSCSTIGLLVVSGCLHAHCTGRRPLPWWLPVVMLIWGNAHPGVIMGQGLLIGAITWEWVNQWLRINPALTKLGLRRLTLIGGLGLAATLICPDPVERWVYPFRPEVSHPIMVIFAELQPLYWFVLRPPFAAAWAYLLALSVVLTIVLRFRHYRLWEIALLAGLAVLANRWYRSLQDWFLLMLAIGVPHLAALVREAKTSAGTDGQWVWVAGLRRRVGPALVGIDRAVEQTLGTPRFRFQWFWPVATLALLAGLSLVPPLTRRLPNPDMEQWPIAALNWMDAQGIEGRFFAPPNYGAYVIWRLGDRARSYVDTRGFFFPAELVEDSHLVPQLGPEWRTRLDRVFGFGTDYFLLETTGPRGKLWQTLKPFIGQPLYCDEQTVLITTVQVRQGVAHLESAAQAVAAKPRAQIAVDWHAEK